MKQRPLSIWIISAIYMLIAPVGFGYVAIASRFDGELFSKMMRWDVALVLLAGSVVGYGVFRVRPWGYFAFLGYSSALVLGMSFRHFLNPTTFSYFTVVGFIAGVGAIAAFIQKHFSAPYFNPHLRWWESDPRFQTELNVSLSVDGGSHSATVRDLSRSGCFLSSEARVAPGDVVKIKITLLDYQFSSEARVIRVSEKLDGFGLMFYDLDKENKKTVKAIIKYLCENHTPTRNMPISA
ncbi:MAG: PilZ domain-containing protein [Bdellovibrionales bacterium]|nr:PilZ domain-containing protein [Bdellovibrionales bacterium]